MEGRFIERLLSAKSADKPVGQVRCFPSGELRLKPVVRKGAGTVETGKDSSGSNESTKEALSENQ